MSGLQLNDFVDAFRSCGIARGDALMLHCDAMVLAQMPPMPKTERFDVFFRALDEVLGDGGTLILPTFTYSFTKGEPFSPADTPSTVGPLTEHFRRMPGALRSRDPLFSVAARGRLAQVFASAGTDDCFGPASAFAILEDRDAWLGCLGCSLDRITFTHYVEQKMHVDYRYPKIFEGKTVENGSERKTSVSYFVRDLDRQTTVDLSRLKARLASNGALATAALGRIGLTAVKATVFLAEAQALLAAQPNGLITEGSHSEAGHSA